MRTVFYDDLQCWKDKHNYAFAMNDAAKGYVFFGQVQAKKVTLTIPE